MTKEEIYIQLGYTGTYTKEVKRRLRQLIKKYHPDVYHGDDSIMKLLNKVREEIELDRVDSIFYQQKKKKSKEEPKAPQKEKPVADDYFIQVTEGQLQGKIEQLKKIQKELSEKIREIDREVHRCYEEFAERMKKYEELKFTIEELQKQKKNHFPIIALSSFSIIFFLLLLAFFISSILPVVLVLLILVLFLVYAFLLSKRQTIINREISRSYANKNTYFNQVLDSQEKIEIKEKERFDQYVFYRKNADDIQLYFYELSKKGPRTQMEKKNQQSKIFK